MSVFKGCEVILQTPGRPLCPNPPLDEPIIFEVERIRRSGAYCVEHSERFIVAVCQEHANYIRNERVAGRIPELEFIIQRCQACGSRLVKYCQVCGKHALRCECSVAIVIEICSYSEGNEADCEPEDGVDIVEQLE